MVARVRTARRDRPLTPIERLLAPFGALASRIAGRRASAPAPAPVAADEAATPIQSPAPAVPEDDIPFPKVDLDRLSNPIPAILAAPEFGQADRYFVSSPSTKRSLVSARSHAVIHSLLRNQRPAHAVEIGTYRGGTTETMVRAVHANGAGTVHTVGPFDAATFKPVFEQWPREFQQAVRFYPVDSMAFYMDVERQKIRLDFVFVDGNHDYEFALFDILCAARRLTPGGFIVIDNVAQVGPFFAARDFKASHPDWIDCRGSPSERDRTKAFDRGRTFVIGTDFIILRAPTNHRLNDDRPRTFGEVAWNKPEVRGLALALDGRQGPGTLHVQCILRGFGNGRHPVEVIAAASKSIEPGTRTMEISLPEPATVEPGRERYSIESWLVWIGQGPLCLTAIPSPL